MWVVKRATSLFNSFCSIVQNKLRLFCCPFFRTFRLACRIELLIPILLNNQEKNIKLLKLTKREYFYTPICHASNVISYTLTVWSLVKNNNKTDNKLYSSVRNFSYITVRKQFLDLPPLSLLLNVLKAKVIRWFCTAHLLLRITRWSPWERASKETLLKLRWLKRNAIRIFARCCFLPWWDSRCWECT